MFSIIYKPVAGGDAFLNNYLRRRYFIGRSFVGYGDKVNVVRPIGICSCAFDFGHQPKRDERIDVLSTTPLL